MNISRARRIINFFRNPFIDSIKVTGELFKGNDPLENMRELAL